MVDSRSSLSSYAMFSSSKDDDDDDDEMTLTKLSILWKFSAIEIDSVFCRGSSEAVKGYMQAVSYLLQELLPGGP